MHLLSQHFVVGYKVMFNYWWFIMVTHFNVFRSWKIWVFENWLNRHPRVCHVRAVLSLEMTTFWTRVAENPSWRNRWAFQYATMPLCDPGIALSWWSQKWGPELVPRTRRPRRWRQKQAEGPGASGADGGSSGPTLAAQSATKWLTGVVRCMVPFNFRF